MRGELYWMHTPDFLFEVRASDTGQFVYQSINPAFEASLGISSEDICERAISACMNDEDAKAICASCETCLAEHEAVYCQGRLALGGRQQRFETIVTPIRDPGTGRTVKLVGSHRALKAGRDAVERTARRRAAANLDVQLLSLQEEMQQRIASDLHDSTCQHLIAASLTVMRMRHAMSDIDGAGKLCDEIDASVDQALKEIRAFSYLLHPQDLLADGLKTTIEKFVRGFSARTSLRTSLEIAPEVDELSYESKRSILRVIQEAVANVFRHARATQVKVAMEAADTHFKLLISDNGRGMSINQSRSGAKAITFGVGIPAMRTRLRHIGGVLEIHSSSARGRRGTTLRAVIPRSLPRKRARLPERRQSHINDHKSVA